MYSTEFTYMKDDGVELQVWLDHMKIIWDGDGWNEPYTVTVEDFDILWAINGDLYTKVSFMNHGIVTRTLPVTPDKWPEFEAMCTEKADAYAVTAEPDEPEPDYDYSY